ncbi:ABC transporter ATP-binding protein [Salinicoccus albus]|uniref:ABC transporter ATP-binding protein n=1 Tax=Salinicoccus albus TaxID=418756 RepID=UPI000371ACD7|nr:ABC transporter ATP-binding protein [Salinicoccus albus]
MIEIKNLRLRFPDAEEKRFTGLDITIKEKEKVLILGPSGSGKSTLLNVMGSLIPHAMEVPLKASVLNVPKNGAYVFQEPDSQFTMPSVAEELAFVLENKSAPVNGMEERIKTVLDTVGLDVDIRTTIDTLSGGMKQKLAVASALLQNAETFFLDEPTSMLDESAARNLWETVGSIWDDKTVVIVEHRVDHIWDMVDRVILMDDSGGITADGAPGQILEEQRALLDAFGVWHPYSWHRAPAPVSYDPGETLIRLEGLKITRGKRQILHADGININKGEWVTVEGGNGSGKTSFLLAIMKLIKSDGRIHYRDRNITKTSEIAGDVYPVFQNPELQFITHKVFDEVYINLELHFDKTEAMRQTGLILERMGLAPLSHLHPLEISTGQKRRLSVATAAGGVPEVIMLDEPTFGLDQNHAFRLLELFDEMVRQGTTVVMITHDEEIKKRYPSKRLMIEDGMLREKTGVENA